MGALVLLEWPGVERGEGKIVSNAVLSMPEVSRMENQNSVPNGSRGPGDSQGVPGELSPDDDRWLTIPQLAEVLEVSVDAVRPLVDGRVTDPTRRIYGYQSHGMRPTWRVPISEIVRLIELADERRQPRLRRLLSEAVTRHWEQPPKP